MSSIWVRYEFNMSSIWVRYEFDMSSIRLRYDIDMTSAWIWPCFICKCQRKHVILCAKRYETDETLDTCLLFDALWHNGSASVQEQGLPGFCPRHVGTLQMAGGKDCHCQGGVNALLNYGYTVLRAATARALVSAGLTPSLGIFHHNRSNAFPLADDLMEPYRPFVDEVVFHLCEEGKLDLNKETKTELLGVLMCDTFFPKVTRPLQIGLSITMASLAKCYAGKQKKLSLPSLKWVKSALTHIK